MRGFRQFPPLHAHAFRVTHQMRRTVYSDFITCCGQHRFQRTAGRAFSVGARHRKDKWRGFQHAQFTRHLADALKAQIDGFTVQVFQIRKPRRQRRRGLRNTFIVHDACRFFTLRKAKGSANWPCPFVLVVFQAAGLLAADYSAHPWASPFGAAACGVQICSRQICRSPESLACASSSG